VSASPRAGSLALIGGALALDFCNTTTGRGGAHFVEHLFDYEDLLRWSVHAGIVTQRSATRLLEETPPREAEASFRAAMTLRAELNTLFDALAAGRRAPAAVLRGLAARYATLWSEAELVASEGGFEWRFPVVERCPDALLEPIVRSAVEVLTARDLTRLKGCPGTDCGWVFLDATKNAGRVWCEMEVCGTRAKLRARAARRQLSRKARGERA
jgi:predicted RNA-binding Zn ribbon-like protein